MKKGTIFLLWCVLFCSEYSLSQKNDSLTKNKLFELSFGNNLLFIKDSKLQEINTNDAVVLPTKSMLFFAEFFPQNRFRIPVFFNLPTETKEFLVNGVLISEKASPTFGTGVEVKLLSFKTLGNTKIDLEVGPLASFILDKNKRMRFAPVIAGRVRIMRGENFVMYIGASYSVGINAFGLLYGTGTIF